LSRLPRRKRRRYDRRSMRFDERFPHAQNFHDILPGLFRGRFEKPCHGCGEPTRWRDQDLGVAVCSEECVRAVIVETATTSGDLGLLRLLQVVELQKGGTERPYPLDMSPMKK
jgi:hypothetical protein